MTKAKKGERERLARYLQNIADTLKEHGYVGITSINSSNLSEAAALLRHPEKASAPEKVRMLKKRKRNEWLDGWARQLSDDVKAEINFKKGVLWAAAEVMRTRDTPIVSKELIESADADINMAEPEDQKVLRGLGLNAPRLSESRRKGVFHQMTPESALSSKRRQRKDGK